MPQVDNPRLHIVQNRNAAKKAIKTLPPSATQAQVRDVLNALVFLLFTDDADVTTNTAHLPSDAKAELDKLK